MFLCIVYFVRILYMIALNAAVIAWVKKQKQGGVFQKQILSVAQQEMLHLFLTTNMQFFSWDKWEGFN